MKYLQNIVETLYNTPEDWNIKDFEKFSTKKSLFKYQQEALENAIKALYFYYETCKGSKSELYYHYKIGGLKDNLDYLVKGQIKKYLEEYDKDFPITEDKVSFEHFINRMSFWMATGSGKTLVIVKLIESLYKLMELEKIPRKDILFLTYRDDLIEQFKKHIQEYNQSNNGLTINLINLKEYGSRKSMSSLSYGESVDVFYYRSDLISDEQKEKFVDFRNYDNDGNWYVILDEAHKGDKEESKRQIFYSILSRNGFLFNFSATFTDPRDTATCVYDFNLSRFVKEGYGKHICLSNENIRVLGKKDNSLEDEKQKILLKVFILLAVINKVSYEKIIKVRQDFYHKPLLLTLVNSVNTEDSDLELFFREMAKIAGGEVSDVLFETSKNELHDEFSRGDFKYEFESEKSLNSEFWKGMIKKIEYKDVLYYVFNSEQPGEIEVLKVPSNKQELVFKLKTSSRPFALMKIGDISRWLKEKLSGYEITERFEDESFFANINYNKDINILMGSRSFYEGWDSNRPNIILFINIGAGVDAKKFVLQSIGRGVRIEPIPNERRRANILHANSKLDEEVYNKIEDKVDPLETLFVFGTKADVLTKVLETLEDLKEKFESLGDDFEVNPEVKDKLILVPVYTLSDKMLIDEKNPIKYPISQEDSKLVKAYLDYLGDKVICCKFDCNLKILKTLKGELNKLNDSKQFESDYFKKIDNNRFVKNPELLIRSIFEHFENRIEKFKEFKKLEDEILHFKRIEISKDKLGNLKSKIEKVKAMKDKKIKEEELLDELKIKYVSKHYYIPLVLSENEKINFIKHIVKTKSEVDFIEELETFINSQENEIPKDIEWWYFSKIDETLDKVYIPYYNPTTNRIERFKPDFIFWLKKGSNYYIVFVDPKSIAYTGFEYKIDGFSQIFEENYNGTKKTKVFQYQAPDGSVFNVIVKVFIKPNSGECPEGYKPYCINNVKEIFKSLEEN